MAFPNPDCSHLLCSFIVILLLLTCASLSYLPCQRFPFTSSSPSPSILVFAAIRLTVLEEPESDEEVIFDQQPQPQKTGWSLDAEGGDLEDKPHNCGRRRKSKVVESAQSEVAFSSPLVRRLANRKRRPAARASLGRLLLLLLSFVLKSQRSQFILSRMRKHVNSI